MDLFKGACDMGLEGIVSKRALNSYRSGPSKFWLKTKNVVESELVLLGTDYDNEGKPIAYLVCIDGEPKWQDGITEVSVMQKNAVWFYLPRILSLMLPTAFWIFPPTFWAFPSALSFESPVSLPAADFTLPLA
jgi:hypothetical protein